MANKITKKDIDNIFKEELDKFISYHNLEQIRVKVRDNIEAVALASYYNSIGLKWDGYNKEYKVVSDVSGLKKYLTVPKEEIDKIIEEVSPNNIIDILTPKVIKEFKTLYKDVVVSEIKDIVRQKAKIDAEKQAEELLKEVGVV